MNGTLIFQPRSTQLPDTDDRSVIWVGTAGTGAAYGIVRSVRTTFGDRFRLVASDINPAHLVAASAFVDEYIQVPPVADAEFTPRMLSLLETRRAALYIPILDEEIVWAAAQRDAAALPVGLDVLAPPAWSAEICFDKLAAAHWLVEHGLPTPATALLASTAWTGAACFVKPRCGRGSVGARMVRTEADFSLARLSGEDLVVQELCAGPEITVDVFASASHVRAVARERLEVKAGVCTKARVFDDPALQALATSLARGLQLRGVFCFQVMRSLSTGDWLVTDINPRSGAGTRLTVACGVEVLAAAIAERFDLEFEPLIPALKKEHFVVRQYVEHVLT